MAAFPGFSGPKITPSEGYPGFRFFCPQDESGCPFDKGESPFNLGRISGAMALEQLSAEPPAGNTRMKESTRTNVLWIVAGGVAFWLPTVTLSAIFRWNVSTTALNIASLAWLMLFVLLARLWCETPPKWGWALAGIYILGPAAMLAAAAFTPYLSLAHISGGWFWMTVYCLLPPMTLWMATLNGMIFSVLAGSAMLLVLAVPKDRISRMFSAMGTRLSSRSSG
jgi:hypothetical protein